MFNNYLKVAWRNLRKNIGYSLINIFSLAIGIAGALLILLFVREELSFDRFHDQDDRIYRLSYADNEEVSALHSPNLGPVLNADLAEVRNTVRFLNRDDVLLSRKNQASGNPAQFYESGFLYTDSTFFEIFSFTLLQGRPETSLDKPFTLVLTEKMARKYFPDKNPIGKTLLLQNRFPFEVTGIVQNPTATSSIQFNFLASFSTLQAIPGEAAMLNSGWRVTAYPTYVLLDPLASKLTVEQKIQDVIKQHTDIQFVLEKSYHLEALTDVHLFSAAQGGITPGSDIRYVYIFSIIAFLILLIGSINYMNLATARSARRAREIGIRKVSGAMRSQLVRQLLSESILLSLFALILSLLIVELLLPFFRQLTQRNIEIHYFGDPTVWLTLLGFVFVVGLLAGSYPALLLSGFHPVEILKGNPGTPNSAKRLRENLVVLQFAISIILIASAVVIQSQLHYVRNKNLGLDKERIVVLPLKDDSVRKQAFALANELRKESYVQHVALSSSSPTRPHSKFSRTLENREEVLSMGVYAIDSYFLNTLEIELVSGRGFSDTFLDASQRSRVGGALINESAMRALRWDDPLGQQIPLRPNGHEYAVVGIVKDFHFGSMHEEIGPILFVPISDFWVSYVSIKLNAGDLPTILTQLGNTWNAINPNIPFDYFFLDTAFDQLYKAEYRFATIFNVFTITAILIACLGLFGLAAFTAEQRTKEIGVRKVLGATVANIAALISKDFIKLVLLANLIAWPVAWFTMNKWLQNFAYRIDVGWSLFLLAGGLALVIALLTVSIQAIKAALANPVESLRYE